MRTKTIFRLTAIVMLLVMLATGCSSGNYVKIPYKHSEVSGKNADTVLADFKAAGFTNITEKTKETIQAESVGKVESLTIDGNKYYTVTVAKKDTEIIISRYELKMFMPSIAVDIDGKEGFPEFLISTNLPDKTELALILDNNDDYCEQKTVTIKDGKAQSEAFNNGYNTPLSGDYKLIISISPKDSKALAKVAGTNGECLQGRIVERNESEGFNYIHYERDYHSAYTKGEIETAQHGKNIAQIARLIEQDLQTSLADSLGATYKVTTDDGGINATISIEGMAELAAYAVAGDKDSKDTWDSLMQDFNSASVRLQENYLTAYGYNDKVIVFNLANDQDASKVLYQAYNGFTIFDCVNGIGTE